MALIIRPTGLQGLPPNEPKDPPVKPKPIIPTPALVAGETPADKALTPYQQYQSRVMGIQKPASPYLVDANPQPRTVSSDFAKNLVEGATVGAYKNYTKVAGAIGAVGIGAVKEVAGTVADAYAPTFTGNKLAGRPDALEPKGTAEQLGASQIGAFKYDPNASDFQNFLSSFGMGTLTGVTAEGRALSGALNTPEIKAAARANKSFALSGGAGIYNVPENVIGYPSILPGLSKGDQVWNAVKQTAAKVPSIGDVAASRIENEVAKSAIEARKVGINNAESVANQLGQSVDAQASKLFQFDKRGVIPALKGVDVTLPEAPTIADIAANYPAFEQALSPDQQTFFMGLRAELQKFDNLLAQAGVDVNKRGDIKPGGFYVPRGRADLEGADNPIKIFAGGGVGGKKGFEKAATFGSQAEGIANGFEYAKLSEAITSYARDAGTKATDAITGQYLKDLGGGTTAADRVSPTLRAEVESLRNKIQALKGTVISQTTKAKEIGAQTARAIAKASDKANIENAVTDINASLDNGDLDAALNELTQAESAFNKEVRLRGGNINRSEFWSAKAEETGKKFDALRQQLEDIKPKWARELQLAGQAPRDTHAINLPGLQGVSFPDAVANSANKYLVSGTANDVFRGVNGLYAGMKATLDNSVVGIQLLLASGSDPAIIGKVAEINAKSWWDPQVLGAYFNDFNKRAVADGAMDSGTWAKNGLHFGATTTEFGPQGTIAKLQKVPGIREANRVFGYTGDAARLEWADDLLRDELRSGRTLQDIVASGDVKRIADTVNKATGWSPNAALSSLGNFVFFAPRFLQSRLETLASAMVGTANLLPGRTSTIDQRIARNSFAKYLAAATTLTVAANTALGEQTDFRPFVMKDGTPTWNPNFMRIRFGGNDISLLGPWDSIARAMTMVGSGQGAQAIRGLSSGTVAIAWDLFSGKDYNGKPTTDSPKHTLMYLASNLIPISAGQAVGQNIPQVAGAARKGDVGGALAGSAVTAGQFLGLKTSPLSLADIQEITSKDLYDKPYADLNAGQRKVVASDPRVKERTDSFTPDVGTPKQQTTAAVTDWKDEKANLVADLGKKIPVLQGADLRKAIQDFKGNSFQRSDTLFNNDVVKAQLTRDNAMLEDILAERYWSTPAPEDPNNDFQPNYAQQDSIREGILAAAKLQGIDTNYITGSGAGTYRGVRYDNPAVNDIISKYDADQKTLKPYWEAGKALGIDLNQLAEYQASTTIFKAKYGDGASKEMSAYAKALSQYRESIRRDPTNKGKVDAALIRWGYATKPLTPEGADEWIKLVTGK